MMVAGWAAAVGVVRLSSLGLGSGVDSRKGPGQLSQENLMSDEGGDKESAVSRYWPWLGSFLWLGWLMCLCRELLAF